MTYQNNLLKFGSGSCRSKIGELYSEVPLRSEATRKNKVPRMVCGSQEKTVEKPKGLESRSVGGRHLI